jgi:endonuclease YncB( thermonuclease family)
VARINRQTVTDGDILKFADKRMRLWGIDAPEITQGVQWLAGGHRGEPSSYAGW